MNRQEEHGLALIAHELRNHLYVIQNATFLLKRRLSDEDAQLTRLLNILEVELGAARSLVERLLDYQAMPALALEEGDVASWVSEAVRTAVPPESRVRVTLPKGPVYGRADRAMITRMVRNLVLNAVEAIGPDGGEIEVSVNTEGGMIRIDVADNGPGIPEGKEEEIFEPFRSWKPGGTGLGLAFVKSVAKAHGGKVTAANRAQGGAVFSVYLRAGGP